MLTKDEAMEKVWSYFKDRGIFEKKQPSSVRLITRDSLDEDPRAIDLKTRRPEAWAQVVGAFRDHWCVMFETGFRSPPYNIVNVDAETGEVTLPQVL